MDLLMIPVLPMENIISFLDIESIRNLLLINRSVNLFITNIIGSKIIALRSIELSKKNKYIWSFLIKIISPKLEIIISNIFTKFYMDFNIIYESKCIDIIYYNTCDSDFKLLSYFKTISNDYWNKLCIEYNKNSIYQNNNINCIKYTLSKYKDLSIRRKQRFKNSIYSTEKYTFFLIMYLYLYH